MANKAFWQNRVVLVTGGGGFIGSHLVKALVQLDAQVIVLDLASKLSSSIFSKSEIKKVQYVQGNISQSRDIDKIFLVNQISTVFHLAAKPLVEVGDTHPESVFEANVMGTVHILEAVRRQKNCSLVLASTAHVYGENQVPLLEEYFPRPSRPYETSKACADMIAQTYAGHYSLPVAIARFVNIYGPGDTNMRLIPRTINLLMKNGSPHVYNQRIKRDFLFIDDAIQAYLDLGQAVGKARHCQSNIIYNFGSGRQHTVLQVINLIRKLMKKTEISISSMEHNRTQDVQDQYLSVEKAKRDLNWQANTPLKSGLQKTIDWYQTNQ